MALIKTKTGWAITCSSIVIARPAGHILADTLCWERKLSVAYLLWGCT